MGFSPSISSSSARHDSRATQLSIHERASNAGRTFAHASTVIIAAAPRRRSARRDASRVAVNPHITQAIERRCGPARSEASPCAQRVRWRGAAQVRALESAQAPAKGVREPTRILRVERCGAHVRRRGALSGGRELRMERASAQRVLVRDQCVPRQSTSPHALENAQSSKA